MRNGGSTGRGTRTASLLLATLWLAVSIGAGIWMIASSPTHKNVDVRVTHLTASSEETEYGGDAYTGIQNAASDTEHAVVDGVNGLARMEFNLAQASMEQRHDDAAHLADGVGFLIIGIGVATFILTLQRQVHTV
jgi:hypothetical protein